MKDGFMSMLKNHEMGKGAERLRTTAPDPKVVALIGTPNTVVAWPGNLEFVHVMLITSHFDDNLIFSGTFIASAYISDIKQIVDYI